jgi:ceramide glucosyltransferase
MPEPPVSVVIEGLLIVGVLASWVFYAAGYVSAHRFFGAAAPRRCADGEGAPLPAVTILKPLKGLDAELYENLASYCRLDYPTHQIVVGVRDGDDPALDVVARLRRDYPNVRIDLVVDGTTHGTNYKISNLHNMYRAAAHDIIVIADSDIRVPPDYLRRLAPELRDPTVGVVSCLYRAVPLGSAPTRLEALFINTDFMPMVLVARLVEKPTYAFGATMALRRGVLDEIGGFLPLRNFLADDYHIGQRVVARGYRSVLADLVVETVLGRQTWLRLLQHQLRWTRTYRTCRPRGYFCSIITHGTLWATLLLLLQGVTLGACLLAVSTYALRSVLATRLARRYLAAPVSWLDLPIIPMKDLLGSLMWSWSYIGDAVVWSGSRFRVQRNGELLIDDTPSRTARAYARRSAQDQAI